MKKSNHNFLTSIGHGVSDKHDSAAFNKRIFLVLFLVTVLIGAASAVCASDANSLNITDEGLSSADLGIEGQTVSQTDSEVIYFNASAASDGDGTKSKPYKYVNENTLGTRTASENGLTAYFSKGVYDITSTFNITSPNVVLIGEGEDTVFNSLFDDYDFEIMEKSCFELNNLTFNNANILNYGTLKANGIRFNDGNPDSALNGSDGGIIRCDVIENSGNSVYLNNCEFFNASAYRGGVLSLTNTNLTVTDSRFHNSKAKQMGGAIYALNSIIVISDSSFEFSNASYGGVIYCDDSVVDLTCTKISESESGSYGGVMACKNSDITLENCNFEDYASLNGAGGAIYNVKGNLNITNSSFIKGRAVFGGAVANLQSNLSVSSSRFINNSGKEYGGVVYSVYGNIYVTDSFFNNSHSFSGAAFNCRFLDSITVTNNIFLNSTSESACIFLESSNCKINESGNHFEDIFHMYMEYQVYLNGEEIIFRSEPLNYILSNTGTFLNTYDLREGEDKDNAFITLDMNHHDYPHNVTIFGDYNTTYTADFYFNRHISFDSEAESNQRLLFNIYNDVGDKTTRIRDFSIEDSAEYWRTIQFIPKSHMIDEGGSFNFGSDFYSTALIDSSLSDLTTIPKRYDSRDYGYVTPVKDQGNGGNCWAFSGIATLETCIKKATNITFDFSEANAKNLMTLYSNIGLNLDTNVAGFDSMIMAYLNSWVGPLYEEVEIYDDSSSLSATFYSKIYIQNIYFLPPRENAMDNDLYKKAIMDYGAISVTLNWAGDTYHSLSIVGWDDNYNGKDCLGNYTRGAWIFKNSYGDDWGDGGYGYLSYETPFSSDVYDFWHAYTFVFSNKDSYSFIEQYDYGGVSDYLTYDGHIFYKNTFRYAGDSKYDRIAGFATYFKYPTNYAVSVYLNGKLIKTQKGFSYAGYYTIPLDIKNHPRLEKDDEITIVIENRNDGWNCIPVCQARELNDIRFKENTSFVSFDGKNWFDLYNLSGYTDFLYEGVNPNTCQVACIKLFLSHSDTDRTTAIKLNMDKIDALNPNEKIRINMTLNSTNHFDLSDRIDDTFVTVNINGKDYCALIHNSTAYLDLSFDKLGTYTVTAQYASTLYTSNVIKFSFAVKNAEMTVNPVTKTYGGKEKLVVILRDDGGNALANTKVRVVLNGRTSILKTDSKGRAFMAIDIAPKTYTATVSFLEGGKYYGAAKKVKITVKKAASKLKASKKTFKSNAKSKTYTVTLKSGSGKAVKNAKVKITVAKKTYTAKTDSKGKATFKLNKLTKKGTFKAAIKYSGGKYYKSAGKTVKITVIK